MVGDTSHYPLHTTPFRLCLERDVFLAVQVWNDQPRIDLHQCPDSYPTQKGCILTASRWAILSDHLEELEKKMTKVLNGDTDIDFKIHLGRNLYAAVKTPFPILDIRLRFMNEGKLLHTKRRVTLMFLGLNRLKQIAHEAIPRTKPCYLVHQETNDEMGCARCKECSPNTYML